MQKVNESMCYESILTLVNEDYKRAYEVYSELKGKVDLSDPLPSFSSLISALIKRSEDEIDSVWRAIRLKYQNIKASYEILDEKNILFPKELLKSEYPVPFLYALGNIALLDKERLTVIGSLSPSETASAIVKETASFIKKAKVALFTPLRLGISSIAIADTLKECSSVIAFSSSFVTKAPNERLKAQMVDLYKMGALILSVSGPARMENKWHQVVRNRAISSLSTSVFLVEEKDGGASWKIFDDAKEHARAMLSSHFASLDGYSFTKSRLSDGVLEYKNSSDLKKLLEKKEKRVKVKTDLSLTPDLF